MVPVPPFMTASMTGSLGVEVWVVHRWSVLQNFRVLVTMVGMQMVLVGVAVDVIVSVARQAVMYQAAA